MRPTMVNLLSRGLADRLAVGDAGTMCLDYAHLCNAADALGAGLAARSVLPGDVVATAIPGGVAYLVAFAGTAAARAALAALVPDDERDAHERLTALGARLVLATADVSQGIRVAAARAAIPVAILDFDDQGAVRLDGEQVFEANGRVPDPDDIVLITPDGPLRHHEVVAEALAAAPAETGVVRTTLSLLDHRGLVAALTVFAGGGQVIVPTERPTVAA